MNRNEAYIGAIQNSLSQANDVMRLSGLDTLYSFVIPSPYSFLHHVKKRPWLWSFVFRMMAILWWPLIFPVLILYGVGRFSWLVLRHRGQRGRLEGDVIVVTSHRVADVVPRLPAEERPHIWLTVPWVSVESKPIPEDDHRLSLLSLVRVGDILGAIFDAWQGALAFTRVNSHPMSRIFTFQAYSWFLVWRVLIRGGESVASFWFANHYDRWAILLDQLPLKAQRVMLQHGVLMNSEMPTRIKNLNILYSFDKESERLFFQTTLAEHASPECRPLPAELDLKDISGQVGTLRTALIIAEPDSTDMECRIARRLVDTYSELYVYLKPHPVFSDKYYRGLKHERIHVIREKNMFPKVDLALCTCSTLGLEYEASNIKVLWYEEQTITEVISQVGQYLKLATIDEDITAIPDNLSNRNDILTPSTNA